MVTFLLDTNALSEPFRAVPNDHFLRHYRTHAGDLAIASVTWHEALFGAARLPEGKRKRAVDTYLHDVILATIKILPYDAAAAEWHARERARLGKRGRSVPYADGQIAAVAVVNDFTLVTANVRDFKAFAGLRVENWTA